MATATKLRTVQLVHPNIAYTRDDGGRITAVLVCVGSLVPNPLNGSHGHWRTKADIRESQRLATMAILATVDPETVLRALGGGFTRAHFVRLGPGTLDDDAVPGACKSFRDQLVAWWAGDNTPTGKGDDGPKCGIAFTYAQQRQRPQGVRIEIGRNT
jgi:hypothetical protein